MHGARAQTDGSVYDGSCMAHNDNFTMGAQGQFIRFQHAQWALVKIPGKPEDYSEGMLKSLLTLSDVMVTGYHAARTARVQPGDTVIVLGDGAVGQCGIIAVKMMGAKRIISTSRHEDRRALAQEFGATDNVAARGDEGVAKLLELSDGGADAVLDAQINPGKVFTQTFGLDQIQQAYEAMDQRKTIKSYLIVEGGI
ncbi:molecular chaperone GroES [Bifidobacterium pseudolongum PV8-2]|uniref:Molecular chaperone GroES n=3 Tax=Bifidobacterium pseudolongum TaxID=1694 RepID=A0A0A7IAU4_9BIFI|nr:molecular chaperone GroES [Bifidobacterium pseudolongum PV8-2]